MNNEKIWCDIHLYLDSSEAHISGFIDTFLQCNSSTLLCHHLIDLLQITSTFVWKSYITDLAIESTSSNYSTKCEISVLFTNHSFVSNDTYYFYSVGKSKFTVLALKAIIQHCDGYFYYLPSIVVYDPSKSKMHSYLEFKLNSVDTITTNLTIRSW